MGIDDVARHEDLVIGLAPFRGKVERDTSRDPALGVVNIDFDPGVAKKPNGAIEPFWIEGPQRVSGRIMVRIERVNVVKPEWNRVFGEETGRGRRIVAGVHLIKADALAPDAVS